jgi:two-component system cell cycle response regulator DivK
MVDWKYLASRMEGWTVLVVDDEPDSVDVAATLLEMGGVNVITAANGADGLRQTHINQPDFIVSDLAMPEMSGWEMLKRLKDDPVTKEIPVIALTAHAMRGDRERTVAAGFHSYLSKPLRPETFIEDLLKLLVGIPGIAEKLHGAEPVAVGVQSAPAGTADQDQTDSGFGRRPVAPRDDFTTTG